MAKPAGAFAPGQSETTTMVMCADDCSLHFDPEDWTDKQREDHEANVVLTAMLQVAQIYMGRAKDHLALHDLFLQSPWRETLGAYADMFDELFDDVVPEAHFHYYPREGFYQAAADAGVTTDLINLYMVSNSNFCLHQGADALRISQSLNSKIHLAANAPAAGLPVPETLVCKKSELGEAEHFFAKHTDGVMVKVQGLAGARNVVAVSTLDEATEYVAEYADDIEVVLQERLPTESYTEMTVDLTVSDEDITITNVRKILFAEGLWVGNYISDKIELSAEQRSVCLQVGEYVRSFGYSAPQGLNCGIDFFVRGEEIVVIELNARWTGGLFPAHLVERLGAGAEDTVAFIDMITVEQLQTYVSFVRTNLQAGGAFRVVPMGFSPFVQTVEGTEMIYVWQIVIGDFDAFRDAKRAALGPNQLPTAELIDVSQISA